MSTTYPALVAQVYHSYSGTGPGLHVGVVDLDTNVTDRLAIAGLHDGVARMKSC